MAERLTVAEKVYEVKGQSNSEWCFFLQVMGYHLFQEGKPDLAKNSREKSFN
jgi:hypothetical protein